MSEEIDREKCRVRLTKILDDEHIDKYAHIMRIIDDIFIVTENNKDQLVREIEGLKEECVDCGYDKVEGFTPIEFPMCNYKDGLDDVISIIKEKK